MRVLVCGGRGYDSTKVFNWLESNLRVEIGYATGFYTHSIDVLIHGGARGADEGAARWGASKPDCRVLAFPADWMKHGKAAGPIRNLRMLNEGSPDVVIAFPGGHGTANMIAVAEASGIPIIRVLP
jgi:hypothetical protein